MGAGTSIVGSGSAQRRIAFEQRGVVRVLDAGLPVDRSKLEKAHGDAPCSVVRLAWVLAVLPFVAFMQTFLWGLNEIARRHETRRDAVYFAWLPPLGCDPPCSSVVGSCLPDSPDG